MSRPAWLPLALLCLGLLAAPAAGAEDGRAFDVPAGEAAETLRLAARQGGLEIAFFADIVRGVRTPELRGTFRPREALERLLADTVLELVAGESGAPLSVRPRRPPVADPPVVPPSPPPNPTMKSRLVSVLSTILLLVSPGTPLQAEQAAAGTLKGMVSNQQTGDYLVGAQIRVDGLPVPTTTARDGTFVLSSLTAGSHEVEVGYPGLNAQKKTVVVAAGGTVTADFSLRSDVYQLEKFTVSGVREGIAKAQQVQRQAVGIKGVLATDMFPAQNSGNLGEFLKNASGLWINYSGLDARSVTIRGVPASMNLITQDGLNLASANSGGNGRTFDTDQTMIQNFDFVEVSKAPTSDMEGQAVGGQINLITKNPLTRQGGRVINFDLTLNATWYALEGGGMGTNAKNPPNNNGRANQIKPGGTFFYSDRFSAFGGSNNLGIVLTFNDFNNIYQGQQRGNKDLTNGNLKLDPSDPGYAAISQYYYQNLPSETHRKGASLNIYYKLSEATTLHLNNSFSNSQLNVRTNKFQVQANTRDPSSNVINTIAPRASNNQAILVGDFNDKYGYTTMFNLGGKTIAGPTEITYDTYVSKSTNHYYDIPYPPGTAGTENGQFSNIQLTIPNIGFTLTGSPDASTPLITQTAGPNMYDPANATAMVLNSVQRNGQDVWFGQKVDVKRVFNQGPVPFWLKAGIINHDEWRTNDNPRHVWNYTGPANPAEFAKFLIPSATSKWGLGTLPWINPFAVTKFYLANPQLFTENLATAVSNWASRNFEHERITGAYLMGSVTLARKLTITTGFRNEWTFDEGAGKKDDVAAKNRALAAGASAYQAALAEFSGRFRNSNHYSTPMGNLQAKYQITPEWNARASWHMGIGRPDLPEILPQLTTNDQASPPSLTVNNIALQPQFAYNYDVALEYYGRSGFSFVADVFQKNIRNYIASRSWTVASGQDNGFDGQYVGYVATTRYNTGTALFQGLELNASLPFSAKLPIVQSMPWLGHFGWFANYTALRTEQANPLQNFNGGSPNTQGGPPDTKRFQGFIPQTFNTGLSYNFRRGGSLYVKYNERARFLAYTSGPLNVMQKRWHTIDLSVRYPIGYRNYTLFCDVQNVFADRTAFYVQNGLTIRADVAPPIINLGLRGAF